MSVFSFVTVRRSIRVHQELKTVRETIGDQGEPNESVVRTFVEQTMPHALGRRFTSRLRILGLPLLDIQVADMASGMGPNVTLPKKQFAHGWIAIGDIARGRLLAIGQQASGMIAFGGFAKGLVAIGGVSVGVIAVGGVGIGLVGIGGVALGLFSIGAVGVGWDAVGAVALALHSSAGQVAVAYHCATGQIAVASQYALGIVSFAATTDGDSVTQLTETLWTTRVDRWIQQNPIPIVVGSIGLFLFQGLLQLSLYRWRRNSSAGTA